MRKGEKAALVYNEAYSTHGAGIEFYLRCGTERGGSVPESVGLILRPCPQRQVGGGECSLQLRGQDTQTKISESATTCDH